MRVQFVEEATDLTGLLRRSPLAPTAGRRFLEPRVRVPELAPEALDQRGRGFAILRELLVAHLAEHGGEGIDLANRRRRVRLHASIEARDM